MFSKCFTEFSRPVAPAKAREAVERTRLLAVGNVNPQLLTLGLVSDLRESLVGTVRGSARPERA